MGIRVASDVADLIIEYADGFVLQIVGASDVDAALGALAQARSDIVALDPGGRDPDGVVVSQPVLGPSGPLLRVARLEVADEVLESIPAIVVRHLEAAGVADGVVEVPEPGGHLDQLDRTANAVVLRVFPPPAGEAGVLPPAWIDIACEWVLGDLAASDSIPLRLLGLEFVVKVADAPAILHQASLARGWCDVVNGRLDERLRTASITFGRAPHVALAAGGPACDSQALLARFDLLCELGRHLAPSLTYGCIDVEATFDGIGLGLPNTGWRDRGGASPNLVAGRLSDVLVPDVFPFQILGKGHLAGLGHEVGGDPPVGQEIVDGKVEVLIGEPADWLPIYDVRRDAQEEGWELLAPILATDQQVEELLRQRPDRQVDDGPVDLGPEPAGHRRAAASSATVGGTPDLRDITLDTLPHSRRGLHLTFLELVSWLAHEPHSDAPRTVSPVLATYARWFASALDDRRRQSLKSKARRLIGTAGPPPASRRTSGPAPLSPDDVARAWLASDWLLRVQATNWLRQAGLVEAATRLESIGPTSNHLDLVRAVDVLGSATVIAGRRIDLTSSMAGDDRPEDAPLVQQAAWDAWEQAAEACGWVAASEAAGVGVPAELAYATDMRVIECIRDPSMRDELEASHRSLGDTAWAAALHAVADEAWTAGWKAAHPAVDALAVLPLRTAYERATRGVAKRFGGDDDARESSFEAAEAAAKDLLTHAALGDDRSMSGTPAWDAALAAARHAPGADLWSSVQDLALSAVDEGPWEAGMAAARLAVDDVLQGAPDLVARAVGAAVAREASGAAARGVALRAATVARAQGATAAEARQAAVDALAPTVAELQDAAFALLDVLIGVPAPTAQSGVVEPGAAAT